jgi:hypothetical protein
MAISFYEIDPAVIAITEPGQWFTYLKDAKERGATYEIKLGDARLSLARELAENRPQRYHVLVLDAFSGDAIPAHLLTAEAIEIYLQHLAKGEAGVRFRHRQPPRRPLDRPPQQPVRRAEARGRRGGRRMTNSE